MTMSKAGELRREDVCAGISSMRQVHMSPCTESTEQRWTLAKVGNITSKLYQKSTHEKTSDMKIYASQIFIHRIIKICIGILWSCFVILFLIEKFS